MRVGFWDALDLIGVDADCPLAEVARPQRVELRDAWARRGILTTLARLSRAHGGKPILLPESGYRSVEGAAAAPWDWTRRGRVDLVQQRELHRAALRARWGRPWLAGMFWWYWDPDPDAGGPADPGYTPQGKPAAALLTRWYRRQRRCPGHGRGRVRAGGLPLARPAAGTAPMAAPGGFEPPTSCLEGTRSIP